MAGDDPGAIDRTVREHLGAGQSLYDLDSEGLAALRPDVILTQDLCAVCSIDLAAVRQAASGLVPRPEVVSLNPTTIEGVLDDVLRVGEACGVGARALRVVVGLRERLARAQEFVNAYAEGPSVVFLEWTQPLFCAGHWTVQLIERAGGRHVLNPSPRDGPAGASRVVRPEEVIAAAPEYVIVCPCGASFETSRLWTEALAREPWWGGVPAVRSGRVAVVDGNQMFNRPGPRLVEGFEFLVGWLQGRPGLIPAGFPWALAG